VGGATLADVSKTVSGGRNLPEEEDGSDEPDQLGGEREGGGAGLSWFGGELGLLAPRYGPSGLLAPSFIFSFCFIFLLFLISVLGFFEKAILF
jgi:hypothetical protein